MRSYSTITYSSKSPCAVALGCFDGVHLGHSEVIKKACSIAHELGCDSAVWTFDEPPKNYFLKHAVPLITDKHEKSKLISSLGVDKFISVPFTKETANISAEDFFFEILKKKLKVLHIVCGFNYTFGKNGEGNSELLQRLCKDNGIGLTVLSPISVSGITVSSSAIRDALATGQTDMATELLGRPYSLRTVVISGQHLARKLGFPTVNQEFSSRMLVPKYGVYVSRVTVEGRRKTFYGITNVGIRPTVGGTSLFAETNIFDFSDDLYGRSVKVEFLHFIREERKFEDLEALTEQVNEDIKTAREYISTL
ncbi:MAG: bifunctional riboflavin kinase/FAD synthetase [Clostridia bacterium]|nr:bifunctional riboflavin kinase/FAD synthetase [Clostridia bacterium]